MKLRGIIGTATECLHGRKKLNIIYYWMCSLVTLYLEKGNEILHMSQNHKHFNMDI